MSTYRTGLSSRRVICAAVGLTLLTALLALAWFAYQPGLSGAFLFDDLGSLPKLGATGPVDNWATFWRYVTSGGADPTGRPLAMLSFLLDASNWPANPYPFKVTNVVLHLINGVLLAWVLWKLGRILAAPSISSSFRAPHGGDPEPSNFARVGLRALGSWFRAARGPGMTMDERGIAIAALFGAGAWLLHPLFVSTTLYVVQREAMLPATFVLIGMLGWMASRDALARGHVRRALIGFALSSWLCTLLAVLSKANGALLPLLLLLTEWIVLARRPMPSAQTRQWQRRATFVFLLVPTALVLIWLLQMLPGVVRSAPTVRGWTVGQRLLTEPRVLSDYLHLLFVPHAHSSGLFNDAFSVSTGWWKPATTLPAIVLIVGLITTGCLLRRRHPAISLALLFFFAAQLMESGWIPLELYFEHRNYLPALLLFWPIGLALGQSGALRFLRVGAAAAALVVLATITMQRASLWGDAPHQARMWAAFNPDSARAQTSAALYDLQAGLPRLAAARLTLAMPLHPDDLQIPVNLINAECRLGVVRASTLSAAGNALANDRGGADVAFNWFGEAIHAINQHACEGISYADMQRLLNAARGNPHWLHQPGLQQNLDHLQGQLDLAQGNTMGALKAFNDALARSPDPAVALQQAAYLGMHGYPAFGIRHLDFAASLLGNSKPGFGMPCIHAWVLHRQRYWDRETAHLRSVLEVAARQPVGPRS